MVEFKIEKNIPMPPSGSARPTKYNFGDMDIGDSVEGEKNMSCSAHMYGKRHGKKFARRGNRIWRVK